jgi:hypothetical protein
MISPLPRTLLPTLSTQFPFLIDSIQPLFVLPFSPIYYFFMFSSLSSLLLFICPLKYTISCCLFKLYISLFVFLAVIIPKFFLPMPFSVQFSWSSSCLISNFSNSLIPCNLYTIISIPSSLHSFLQDTTLCVTTVSYGHFVWFLFAQFRYSSLLHFIPFEKDFGSKCDDSAICWRSCETMTGAICQIFLEIQVQKKWMPTPSIDKPKY